MKILIKVNFILWSLSITTLLNGQLLLNEIQSSNEQTIADNFLEYDDWIELYNPTNSAINIAGYFISDDSDDLLKHQLQFGNSSLTTIPANGFLLLWADNDIEQGVNHLNFKISSSGETIYLTGPDQTTIIDSLQIPAIPTDNSYIRKPDGSDILYLNSNPTPQSSNNNISITLSKPEINVTSGKYNSSQTIDITADIGTTIYYTTDGSAPTTNSFVYSGPFIINTSKTIKAIATKTDFINSEIAYESYIFGATTNLSIVNISIDPDYLFDNQIGMYVAGTNGTIGPCMDIAKNWWQDWQNEAIITLYEKNGTVGFSETCGVEMSGSCSRNGIKKSFNIKFKNEYGINNLNYQLFEDSEVTLFDGFKLRAGGTHTTEGIIHDRFAQKTIENQIDLDLQYSRPVALYLNGDYWGLYHIRDRTNTGYLQSYHPKVDDENIDFIKYPNCDQIWWLTEDVRSGDNIAYYNMHNFAVNNDLNINTNYKTVADQLDLNELINYLIAELYMNNGDWPKNNVKIWKERTEKGKWRWLFYDVDHITYRGSHENISLFDEFMNNTDVMTFQSTEFYRNLFQNESFKNEFAQRMNTYIHTIWEGNRTNSLFQDMKNEVSSEIQANFNKWGGWDYNRWNNDINILNTFFQERPNYARTMVKNVLGLGGTSTINLNFNANTPGSILMHQNFFKIPHNFSGTYFKNLAMYFHAIPKPGFRFVEWQEINNTSEKYNQNLYKGFTSTQTLTPVFEPALDLVINEIYYNPTGSSEEEEFIEMYNPDTKAKSLWGYQFTNGIQFQFPENSVILPGEYIVIAHNDSAYMGNGYQVFEWDNGSLNNDGEAIVFRNPDSEVIDTVYYNDNSDWDQNADGLGYSLALQYNTQNNNLPTSWASQIESAKITPGTENYFCEQTILHQNEPILSSGTYKAADLIGSNGRVNANEEVSFKAGNRVKLITNFKVAKGAEFKVRIEDCN